MSNADISRIIQYLDVAKLEQNPLPISYIADKADNHLKNLYATMLASVIVAKGQITANENRLFALVLQAIGLEAEPSVYLNNVKGLNQSQVIEFTKSLDTNEKRLNFIFESLLLARIGSPLSEQQIILINEIAGVWNLQKDDVALAMFWIKYVLGLDFHSDNLEKITAKYIEDSNKIWKYDLYIQPKSFMSKNQKLSSALNIFEVRTWWYPDFKVKEKDSVVFNQEIGVIGGLWSTTSVKSPCNGIIYKLVDEENFELQGKRSDNVIDEKAEDEVREFPAIIINALDGKHGLTEIISQRDGYFINGKINEESYFETNFIPLPVYLNNWKDYIKLIDNEKIND